MRTTAILPVKSFNAAKQRLSGQLGSVDRAALVEAMFTDALAGLSASSVGQIVVVTTSSRASEIATERGASVVEDEQRGHNAAAALGIKAAVRAGSERILLVPGDCPLLDPDDVDELLAHETGPTSVLIVPDRHGTGTNSLLLTPPDVLAPSFGPGSCRRHLEAAQELGIQAEVVELSSLALDIDTPEDLASFLALPDAHAPQTRQLLSRLSRC